MKKITFLFCLLLTVISSYAVNEDQIKSFIEVNSDVEVEVTNTSTTPWVVKGEDTLYCTKKDSELLIAYETDYITQLDYVKSSSVSFTLDGVSKAKGAYISAGRHELKIKSSSSSSYVKGLSIKEICRNADVEEMIRANSEVEAEIMNDTINPWVIKGADTLYCTKSGSELVITYETDYILELSCKRVSDYYYVKFALDGKERSYSSSTNATFTLPAGRHELRIKVSRDGQWIKGLSIKEICRNADVEEMVRANSEVEVEIENDTINPWIVVSDTLRKNSGSGYLTIRYETEYITQLNCVNGGYNYSPFIIDGVTKSTGAYIPAGRHELKIASTVKGLSIKKICRNADVEAMIEANSEVEVDVLNDSINPYVVKGEDTLYCTKSVSELVITYETDYITQLNFVRNYDLSFTIDGVTKSNGACIPAGRHELKIKSSWSSSYVKGLSIKKICRNADIKVMIEANSEVEVEVLNDSVNPWVIVGEDSISSNGVGSKLEIKYSSEKLTEISFKNAIKAMTPTYTIYKGVLKVYLDGVECLDNDDTNSFTEAILGGTYKVSYEDYYYFHLPAGEHVITIESSTKSGLLIDFSIQEIDAKDPIKLLLKASAFALVRPKHYYDYSGDGILKPIAVKAADRIYSYIVDYSVGLISIGDYDFSSVVNFNNDEYIDAKLENDAYLSKGHSFLDTIVYKFDYLGDPLDFNNDGYPDWVDIRTTDKKANRLATTIYDDGAVQSNVKLYSLEKYAQLMADEEASNSTRVNANLKKMRYLGLSNEEKLESSSSSNNIKGQQRVIRQDKDDVLGIIKKMWAHGWGEVTEADRSPLVDMQVDANGDGIVDYLKNNVSGVTGIESEVTQVLYLNMGDGTSVYQTIGGDLVDLNSDGVMDVIGFDGIGLVYYLLQQDGSYKQYRFDVNVRHTDFWCYDFDKDGDKDILVAYEYRESWRGCYMMMIENLGNGEYQNHEYFYDAKLYMPYCADIDNDGYYEVVWMVDVTQGERESSERYAEDVCHIEIDGLNLSETVKYWNLDDFVYTYSVCNIIDTDNDGVLELWVEQKGGKEVWVIPLSDTSNAKPNKPQTPTVVYDYSEETLAVSWGLATDKETSSVDLTYALRIGTEPGKGDVVYAHAYADGTRRNFLGGNMSTNRFRLLNTKTWKAGKYYVSIQAIDPNNRGSEFSEEVVFEKTSHAASFELEYNTLHFGVGDTCNVLLHPNVWLDTAAYVTCTGGEVVGVSEDSLTVYVVFSKDGEQTISLCRRNGSGGVVALVEKVIEVSPLHFYKSKTKDTQVALDLNEDGYMEFYGTYYGETETMNFHTYKADGSVSRVNKMFNNNTFWKEVGGPKATIDMNKDGKVDVVAGKSSLCFKAVNTGNLGMTVDGKISYGGVPEVDYNNDGNFDIPSWVDCSNNYPCDGYVAIATPDNEKYYLYEEEDFYYFRKDKDGRLVPDYVKDFTNDGLVDLIYEEDSLCVLYENNGDFTFTERGALWSFTDFDERDFRLASDFDNDGKLDVVYRNSEKSSTSYDCLIINWGDGTKTILEEGMDVQDGPSASSYKSIDFGVFDYNNDGYLDMLAEKYIEGVNTIGILFMLPNHEYKFVPTGYKLHSMKLDSKPYITPNGNLFFTNSYCSYDWEAECIIQSKNERPAAPTNVTAAQSAKGVMITWDHSVDAETPAVRMRYNISVKHKGKSGDGAYLISPCNSTKNGVHVPSHLPLIEGNRFMIPTASIPVGEYEVQVQGVDLHMLESDFSEVFNLTVRETIAIDAPATTGVGVETEITFISNVTDSIDWGGGYVVSQRGNQYVVVWYGVGGLKTIKAGEYSHVINVKSLPDVTFELPSEVMQQATVNVSARNARNGKWEISTNSAKSFTIISESDVAEMLSVDSCNIVLRFNREGQYIVRHSMMSEFGEVDYIDIVKVQSEHVAPEMLAVANIGEQYQIIWKQLSNMPTEVIGYRIYKESSRTDVYNLVGEVGKDSLQFVDMTSNPNVHSSRYALSYVTTYGESTMSVPHQGLHVMINRGVGTTWNLAWMKYEGRDVASYRIWRGTTPENIAVIGEISGNTTSFSDLMTGDSVNYYAVEVIFAEPSVPARMPSRYRAPSRTKQAFMSNVVSTNQANKVSFVDRIDVRGNDIVAGRNTASELTAYVYPYYASYNAVNWVVVSGSDIAQIDAKGVLTANGYTNGNVVVRAYALDGSDVYGETTIRVSGFDDEFTITYRVDDVVVKTEKISFGASVVAPESTKEGNRIEWYNLPKIMPANDVVVEGVYVRNSYLITYTVDGSTYATDSLLYETAIELLSEPIKEGYTFSGWSDVPATMPAHDVVVSGQFNVNSYNVIYMVDSVEYKRVSVVYGTTITLETEPTKEGHTFSGWSSVPITMPAEDVVIEGSFTINKYMVTYNIDGVYYATDSVEYGATIVPVDVSVKEGHTFSWSDLPTTMPARDIVVNGVYTANSYYVIYKVDGVEYKRVSVVYGTTITLEAEPTKEGYTFSGWSSVPTTMPAEDVVIEGSFTVNVYAVIYFVDDELYATDSVAYGEKIVLLESPIKDGFVFSGWSEVPETMPASNVEVRGVFVLDDITIIDDVHASDKKKVRKVIIDDKIYIILPDGTKYSIAGQIVSD